MNSLRTLFRWMLLGWLVLVVVLSIVVARSTDSTSSGNLLAFLFTRMEGPAVMPVLPSAPPAPEPAPAPAPEPKAPDTPKPAAQEWVALHEGKQPGKGELSNPEIHTSDDGSVEILLTCNGTPGNFSLYHPTNVPSLSVDLQGAWSRHLRLDRKIDTGCLYRLQIATHPQWLRLSGIARDNNAVLSAKAEYNAASGIIRVVFSAGK